MHTFNSVYLEEGQVFSSKIHIIGGLNHEHQTNAANEVYDAANNNWRTAKPMPTPRQALSIAAHGGILFGIGGWNGEIFFGTNESYDPVTDTWEKRNTMPQPREGLSCISHDATIYAIGGVIANHFRVATNHAYNISEDIWSERTPMPTPRVLFSTSICNGIVYTIGGSGKLQNGSWYTDANEAYDPESDSWSSRTPMPTPRYGAACGLIDGKIHVIGGSNHPFRPYCGLKVHEAYDVARDTWISRSPLPYPGVFLAACVAGDRLLTFGGYSDGAVDFVHAYDSSRDSWTALAPMPTARYVAGAALTAGP